MRSFHLRCSTLGNPGEQKNPNHVDHFTSSRHWRQLVWHWLRIRSGTKKNLHKVGLGRKTHRLQSDTILQGRSRAKNHKLRLWSVNQRDGNDDLLSSFNFENKDSRHNRKPNHVVARQMAGSNRRLNSACHISPGLREGDVLGTRSSCKYSEDRFCWSCSGGRCAPLHKSARRSDCGHFRRSGRTRNISRRLYSHTSQEEQTGLKNIRGEFCCQRARGSQRPNLKPGKLSCRTSANKQVRCVGLRCACHRKRRPTIFNWIWSS